MTYQPAGVPLNEDERLQALRELRLLDSPRSAVFDRITRVAAMALDTPIVLISLVEDRRQWFLSRVGIEAAETSRDVSFCAHAVYECRPLIVPDAKQDVRFATNPLVTSAPHIRAYAGIPFYTRCGYPLGTLCAIDTRARQLNESHMNALRDCTCMVEDLIHARERSAALERASLS